MTETLKESDLGRKTTLRELLPDEDQGDSQYPEYKKGCPPDRGLLISDGTQGLLVDYIGPALEYWQSEVGDTESWDGYPAGVWIWEGTLQTWQSYEGEYDCDLEGEHRALTNDEWSDFKLDGQAGPWDSDDWISKYPGPEEE